MKNCNEINNIENERKILINFYNFCSSYSEIVIYGAGKIASVVSKFLDNKMMSYDYFVVSNIDGNALFYHNHDVKIFKNVEPELKKKGIIVSLLKADLVVKNLDKKGLNYFYDKNLAYILEKEEIIEKIFINEGMLCKVENIKFKRDVIYICCPYGIGDTLYVAALVKAYKLYNKDISKVYLIVKENHEKIVDLFEGVDGGIVSNKLVELLTKYSTYTATWKLKNYLYGHFKRKSNGQLLDEFYDEKYVDIVSKYKKMVMNLPLSSELENLKENSFSNYDNEKNEIVVMPYAKSIKMLPIGFWKDLCKILISKGFQVYTNVGSAMEKPIDETTSISGDIVEVMKIYERCKAVISLRSGLCDLLAFTKTKLIIINTDYELCNICDLKRIFPQRNIININCYREYNYKVLIDQILESILVLDEKF